MTAPVPANLLGDRKETSRNIEVERKNSAIFVNVSWAACATCQGMQLGYFSSSNEQTAAAVQLLTLLPKFNQRTSPKEWRLISVTVLKQEVQDTQPYESATDWACKQPTSCIEYKALEHLFTIMIHQVAFGQSKNKQWVTEARPHSFLHSQRSGMTWFLLPTALLTALPISFVVNLKVSSFEVKISLTHFWSLEPSLCLSKMFSLEVHSFLVLQNEEKPLFLPVWKNALTFKYFIFVIKTRKCTSVLNFQTNNEMVKSPN